MHDSHGESDEGEDCDIVKDADGEHKPEGDREVEDVLEPNDIPNLSLLPLEELLSSQVK